MPRIHILHRRGQSSSSAASSSSSSLSTPIATVHNAARVQRVPGPTVAVVGTGREALALSPNSAVSDTPQAETPRSFPNSFQRNVYIQDQFAQSLNMNMALCSSPEVNLTFPQPGVEVKPDPVLRRIASEAVVGLNVHSRRSSGVPSLPCTSSFPKGLPPPPRPRRPRPPPVSVPSYGPALALFEQTYTPFEAPKTPTQPRASSVPPSAVSSCFWGAAPKSGSKSLRSSRSYTSQVGSICSTSDESSLDLDGLEAEFDEYEFEDASHRREALRPLRVQVSVEQVAFRDGSPVVRHGPREDEVKGAPVTYGWEDGIKTRPSAEDIARPRQKGIRKALRWLRIRT